jgi:4-amino-4-deoxy-L-arabinose transferase-like glycosyltransferase
VPATSNGTSTPATAATSPARDRLLWALLAACAVSFLAVAAHLRLRDLILDYPFTDGDSWDWIANGLRLSGADVRYSGRPPLLPLAIALLDRLGMLRALPVLLVLGFHLAVVVFYLLAARLLPRRAALVAALFLLVDASLRGLSLEVMADLPAATLLVAALYFFDRAGERPGSYLGAGLAAGLAALTQPAAVLALPAAAVAAAVHRRRDLRSPRLWLGALAAAGLPALWALAKRLAFGAGGDLLVRPADLLRLHLGSAATYLFAAISLAGLPALAAFAPGLALAARRARESATWLLVVLLVAGYAVFFVFVYDYNAKRFLLYPLFPAALCLGLALAALSGASARASRSRRTAFAAASLLVLAAAALPLPGLPQELHRAALWPLPPLYARAAVRAAPTGSPTIDPATLRLDRLPPSRLPALSDLGRLRAFARRPDPLAPFDAAQGAADRAAIYLYDEATEAGDRYRTITRLSDALRKPVRFVPRGLLAAGLSALAPPLETIGAVGRDWTAYRARPLGLGASWVVAVAAGRPLAPAAGAPVQDPAALAAGRAKAAAIARFVAGAETYVAVLGEAPPGDLSPLYLPFLVHTTDLYVFTGAPARAAAAFLAPLPVLARTTIAGTAVRRIVLHGHPSSVVSYLPE